MDNLGLTLAALLAIPTAFAQSDGGDPVAGKKKSLSCQGCHGADGNSTDELTLPSLPGNMRYKADAQLPGWHSAHGIMRAGEAQQQDRHQRQRQHQ